MMCVGATTMSDRHSVARIYHNVALRAPPKRAQGDFGAKPVKTPDYQAKNPQNGTDES